MLMLFPRLGWTHFSSLNQQSATMPFGDPKFTVVNPSPDVDQCLKSLRFSDYLFFGGFSGGSWAYGYIFGKPTRMACANTAMMLGMTCASMIWLQNSRARLRGYRENEREVKMYGAWPVQPDLKQEGTTRFPIACGVTSPATTPPLNWKNYD
ncbi:hypothetical protein ACHAWF_000552 [Thalassiosira exigua]